MKKLILTVALIITITHPLLARVPADTNWRDVFKKVWTAKPHPTLVFVNDSGIYCGGSTIIKNDTVNAIARWDGTNWKALIDSNGMNGINGEAECLTGDNSHIYIGGFFDSAGSTSARNIAMWDGANWHALGSGVNGDVKSITLYNGSVYVTGMFDSAGTVRAKNIAKWNGSAWSSLGNGLYGYVNSSNEDYSNGSALCFGTDGKLYAGGLFDSAGSIKANNIAVWNDTAWSALGGGVTGVSESSSPINSIASCNNYIYVGGYFNKADNDTIYSIARWNGTNWAGIGGLISCTINSLAVLGDDLYVAGRFTQLDTCPANHIAKWSNNQWIPLGSGIGSTFNNWVDDIYIYNDILIAVGFFFSAGDTLYCPNFAFWSENPIPQPMFTEVKNLSDEFSFNCKIYPNPGSHIIKIKYNTTETGFANIRIVDTKGSCIDELFSGVQDSGEHELLWNTEKISPGLYFNIINYNGKKVIKKIIVSK